MNAPASSSAEGDAPSVWRRRVAPAAGLALLLAGGALAVRVTAMTMLSQDPQTLWLFTAAACVLAGVALVLVALPALSRVGELLPLDAIRRPVVGARTADVEHHPVGSA